MVGSSLKRSKKVDGFESIPQGAKNRSCTLAEYAELKKRERFEKERMPFMRCMQSPPIVDDV